MLVRCTSVIPVRVGAAMHDDVHSMLKYFGVDPVPRASIVLQNLVNIANGLEKQPVRGLVSVRLKME
jgi:hypothetical protein